MTEKENLLKFYHHEPIDHFSNYFEGTTMLMQPFCVHELPPGEADGYDHFGVRWIYDKKNMAYTPDTTQKPVLEDICDWRDVVVWPDIDSLDWEESVRVDKVDQVDRLNTVYSVYSPVGPFERLHMLMGFENALISLVSEPEEVGEFFERFTQYKVQIINKIAEFYKPDLIQFHDDAGTMNATFYSPTTWRELIKPVWTKMAKAIHDNGLPCELHSCGNNTDIFIEIMDTGIDSLFIQPINDIKKRQSICKGKVGFMVQTNMNKYTGAAFAKKLTVGGLRKAAFEDIKVLIENGYGDCIIVAMPPMPGKAVQGCSNINNEAKKESSIGLEEDMLISPEMVNAIIWDTMKINADKFTEMIRDRNKMI